MATVFRPLERLRAPRPSLHPGVTGSGSACGRCTLGAKRYLLTDSIVKLKEFQQKKVAIAYNLPSTKEIYFRNLEEKLTQNRLILKEELKTLLHLCQSREDVELARSVIYRYHAENRNFTVGEYKFGPVFMRLCYELDLEDSAVELIKDKRLRGFFLDSTSFNILMDMLFTKGKYESALEVLIEMKNQDVKFSKDTYILAFAVCYKLNSPESFKICTTLREEALIKGDVISRRACCFAVALALNQILIHVRSDMLENVIKILQDTVDRNVSVFVKRHTFSEDVLAKVREKLKDNPTLTAKFEEIYAKLHINGQVSVYTLDAMLCHVPLDKKSNTVLLRKKMRTVSRRTLQPLSQTLLTE
ncbi:pentatricopeptide repeat-containing protein 2, mitochondrial isoform X1 [Peromyscus eremicus]|uniref:pentatricopeptide repeat-containing protein 2, mitochondrial isoform X1 n=1 Tax=Peromyscus eremicus TaxID=42410 RepID=UPI0027DD4654|nr:pentatricopeptide repeat-containing protein 2, mitochondrial isoform X1 [Peromyscus eremicus]